MSYDGCRWIVSFELLAEASVHIRFVHIIYCMATVMAPFRVHHFVSEAAPYGSFQLMLTSAAQPIELESAALSYGLRSQ